MKFSKIMALTVWLIIVCITVSVVGKLLTMSDSICNVIGILIMPVVIYISLKTNCFTNIKFKKRK